MFPGRTSSADSWRAGRRGNPMGPGHRIAATLPVQIRKFTVQTDSGLARPRLRGWVQGCVRPWQSSCGSTMLLSISATKARGDEVDPPAYELIELRPQDFEVLGDGVPQKIAFFIEGGVAAAVPQALTKNAKSALPPEGPKNVISLPAPSPGADRIERTYAICVDTLHSNFANFPPVRTALENFFEKRTAPTRSTG
jgi:hypothetical protein